MKVRTRDMSRRRTTLLRMESLCLCTNFRISRNKRFGVSSSISMIIASWKVTPLIMMKNTGFYRRSHDRGRPRDWPNVELRIPESLIADEANTYERHLKNGWKKLQRCNTRIEPNRACPALRCAVPTLTRHLPSRHYRKNWRHGMRTMAGQILIPLS